MNELTLTNTEFKALASETRVKILKLLKERNYTLSELSQKLALKAPSVKQHLDQLSETGLITIAEEGRKWKYYALTRKAKKLMEPEQTHIMVVLSIASIALVGLLMVGYASFGTQAMQSASTQQSLAAQQPSAPTTGGDQNPAAAPPLQQKMTDGTSSGSGTAPQANETAPITAIVEQPPQGWNPWYAFGIAMIALSLLLAFFERKRLKPGNRRSVRII